MRKFLSRSIIVAALLLPRYVLAWGDTGHLTIAAEAYRQLSPEVKAQVFEILKSHPDFAKWQQSFHPNPNLDLPTTVFMRSATWPDEIRRSGSIYDHPNWHFMDYPLRPPNFPFEPDPQPTNDVLYGIAQSELVLSDTNASPEKRAAYLSYLIHLVGDEHQPLHCASYFTDAYPKGDRGGNDFYVKPANVGIRLHGLWDGLLGSAVNRREQWNYGTEILAKFPRTALPELTTDTTPTSWSLESRKLAIQYGYLNGHLSGSLTAETAPALPPGYVKAAKAVAERQAALAGYRLADEIQTYLKWGKNLPLLPDNTNTTAAVDSGKISVDDATKYYDNAMTMTGKVTRVTVNPNIVFLKFEQAPGAPAFTAIIFKENTSQFGDLQKLNHRQLEINGTITEYKGKPEVILESTNQVKIMDGN